MHSRKSPYEIYLEREKKKIHSGMDSGSENSGFSNHRTEPKMGGDSLAGFSDFARAWDGDLDDWRFTKATTVTTTADNRKAVCNPSLVPDSFRLFKGFPAYFTVKWKGNSGYPKNILLNAKRFSRNPSVRKFSYLADGFLYTNLIGRIPWSSTRKSIQWRHWQKLIDDKFKRGQWELVKDEVKFRNKHGKIDGLGAVYAISSGYLEECIEADLSSGRYSTIASLENRKRFVHKRNQPQAPAGLPDELIIAFAKGTGLRANPGILKDMLIRPSLYQMSMYTSDEVWKKGVFAWRKLAPYPFSENLRSYWTVGKNGWVYTTQPCLQSIPKLARMVALEGLNGERVMEVDLTGCQLNIARVLNGLEVIGDPYEEIRMRLRDMGIDMNRKTVKKHTLAGFGGRTEQNYEHYLRLHAETDPLEYFKAILSVLKEIGYPIKCSTNRRVQGKIMASAMKYMAEHTGYTGLGIHDALLVPTCFGDVAADAMENACREVLGESLPYDIVSPYELV